MNPQSQSIERFELSGAGVQIAYSSGSASAPQLEYRNGSQPRTFRGQELRTTDTPAGKLVSVTTAFVPDVVTLSVLLPDIALQNGAAECPVQTIAYLATQPSGIAGPAVVQGQVQSYRPLVLGGTAKIVKS